MANSILGLTIYQAFNTFCFTDVERELYDEPFVAGMDKIIEDVLTRKRLLKENGMYHILISEKEFPGCDGVLNREEYEHDGAWYSIKTLRDYETEKGWLCPATLKFFSSFPEKIYFQLKYAGERFVSTKAQI